jgi:RimJ/RimL family protein N-acetyltransferase
MTSDLIRHLRPVTIEDAGMVADLESAVTPYDPRDPELLAFWWKHAPGSEMSARWIAERDGVASMYVSGTHGKLKEGARFGGVRVRIRPGQWTELDHRGGVERAESWLRTEGVHTAVARIREAVEPDVRALKDLGYAEIRRSRVWQLDLVRGHDRLLATAARTRGEMQKQGVRLLTLDQDNDPDKLQKLYALDLEASDDVPKTVPWPVPTFEEWSRQMFEHPGHREDRIWLAREGDAIVGTSFIGYPPVVGIPWTSFTATARSVRGRGIARALKYETVAQAIALGVARVQTDNDSENLPILHLNEEMGYEPVTPELELHRELGV